MSSKSTGIARFIAPEGRGIGSRSRTGSIRRWGV